LTLFNRSASVLITTNTNSTLKITGLRITFDIDKTEGKDPNTGRIEIYNLSEDTRNNIRDLGKNVTLFAGYTDGNGEELLFTGDITNISHSISKPEVITTIEASDGKTSINNSKTVISQSGKASGRGILQRVLGEFSIGNNLNQITFQDKFYASGFSFAGLSKDALTKVTDFLELSWSVQNNQIQIAKFDQSDETGVILLTSDTGLLGSPQRLSGESRKSKKYTKRNNPGWRFNSLLFPSINPKGIIAAQSVEIKDVSQFIVYSVAHSGDTHGPEWNSSIEVRE